MVPGDEQVMSACLPDRLEPATGESHYIVTLKHLQRLCKIMSVASQMAEAFGLQELEPSHSQRASSGRAWRGKKKKKKKKITKTKKVSSPLNQKKKKKKKTPARFFKKKKKNVSRPQPPAATCRRSIQSW